jgi:broad specificity phosphatase PhoE
LEPHQPKRHPVELVVSSPLSRALHTAELAMGVDTDDRKFQSTTTMTTTTTTSTTNRVCYEGFREINGWLQNGKRHTKMELELKFPSWDFSLLSSNDDVQWTPTLETTDSCMERGYEGLLWIMKDRPERSIVLVSHGALLKYTLTDHPNVILQDGRKPITTVRPPHCIVPDDTDGNSHSEAVTSTTLEPQQSSSPTEHRCVRQRYHNCEIRRYRMELLSSNKSRECIDENHVPSDSGNMKDHLQQRRDVIILTEVDL